MKQSADQMSGTFFFSLITGTMGRNDDLRRFLNSLDQQSINFFELILLDQSNGKLNVALLDGHAYNITRIVETPGLSRIRNIGMKHASGNILAFPDDDCFYPPDLLENMTREFLRAPELDGISTIVTDSNGCYSAGGYMMKTSTVISSSNIWRTAVSSSIFLRKEAVGKIEFDENLGVGSGTIFGSGEETDFLLKILFVGKRICYMPRYTVYHPVYSGPWKIRRGWLYGCGTGAVLRKHHYSLITTIRFALYQAIRTVFALLMLKFRKALFHMAMSSGRIFGFLKYPNCL